MNNGELKAKLINFSHRADLAGDVQTFINEATENINVRFCMTLPTMVNDADSNEVIAAHGETLYFYGAMRSLSQFIKDWEQMAHYDQLFREKADQMNISANNEQWTGSPLIHVKSESEIVNGA